MGSSVADDAQDAAGVSRSSNTRGPGGSSEGGSATSQGGSAGRGSGSAGSRGSEGSGSGSSAQGTMSADRADRQSRTCATCPEWRYEMGIRQLGAIPFVYSWHHLFLLGWNRGGSGNSISTYSAFPSGNGDPGLTGPIFGAMQSDASKPVDEGHEGDAADPADMGYLKFTYFANYWRSGEYSPTNRFVTLRDTDENLHNPLIAAGTEIDARRIRYVPTGPNSNSFAMSLAERVGLPRNKPSGDAPGSGMSL